MFRLMDKKKITIFAICFCLTNSMVELQNVMYFFAIKMVQTLMKCGISSRHLGNSSRHSLFAKVLAYEFLN